MTAPIITFCPLCNGTGVYECGPEPVPCPRRCISEEVEAEVEVDDARTWGILDSAHSKEGV